MLIKLTFLLVLIQVGCAQQLKARAYLFRAVADLLTNETESIGFVDFVQDGSQVIVTGSLYNVPAGSHGFHVHEFGDINNKCLGTGGHYNPRGKDHGAPTDVDRHVGDLGNVQVIGGNTPTSINIVDSQLSLSGAESILGRGVVLHEGQDDLGRGGVALSKTTGNAGARYACGVIGIQKSTLSEVPSAPISTTTNASGAASEVYPLIAMIVIAVINLTLM